jgi:hypothetical protein
MTSLGTAEVLIVKESILSWIKNFTVKQSTDVISDTWNTEISASQRKN